MYKPSSRHQVDEIRLSVSFVDRAKSRSYGWLTCCCSVNIQVVCKVLKIRELSSHNIHDVTQESLFSVCRASILELQISNKRLTKQLNSTGVSLATLQCGFHLPLLSTAIATTKYTATRIQKIRTKNSCGLSKTWIESCDKRDKFNCRNDNLWSKWVIFLSFALYWVIFLLFPLY